MTYREIYPLVSSFVSQALTYSISPVLFHEDKLVAACTVSYIDEETLSNVFPYESKIRYEKREKKFQIKDDYLKDIFAGPYDNFKANIIHTYLDSINNQCGNMLPSDCKSMIFGELLNVHKDYQRYGFFNFFGGIMGFKFRDNLC